MELRYECYRFKHEEYNDFFKIVHFIRHRLVCLSYRHGVASKEASENFANRGKTNQSNASIRVQFLDILRALEIINSLFVSLYASRLYVFTVEDWNK